MKRKFLIIVVVGALIIGAGFWFSTRPLVADYFVAGQRDFIETVVASGRVEPGRRLGLALQSSGVICEVFFQEGDVVEEGELLMCLMDSLEELNMELARVEADLARTKVMSVANEERMAAREDYNQLVINARTALENYRRVQSLAGVGGVSQSEVVEARDNWDIARSRQATASSRLETLLEGGALWQEANSRLEQAQLRVREAEIALERKRLHAPVDGIIFTIHRESGEYLSAGETVLTLGHTQGLVVVDIDEKEYPRLAVGLEAMVSSTAGGVKTAEAEIVYVAPAVDFRTGTVEVRLGLLDDVFFKPDSAVTVEIILNKREGLVAFPEEFLVEDGTSFFIWIPAEDDTAALLPLNEVERWRGWVIAPDVSEDTVILDPAAARENRTVRQGQERIP